MEKINQTLKLKGSDKKNTAEVKGSPNQILCPKYATEKDIEELEKDSGLEKSQIQNWLKRKRVEQSKRGDKRKWRK